MKQIYLLASLAVLLGWGSAAPAQALLGSPRVPSQESIASEPVVETPASKHRSCFPLFSHVKRTRFTPLRTALANLFPPPPTPAPLPNEVVPTREDVDRMVSQGWHSPAEISAAKIKLDEAQSKFRCAAVRYLATIDCHYYPEAELGLIAALRADRVEAVRYEAAQAIGLCPSVTLRMTEALQLTAQGFDTDGNPGETSERVRQAARNALQRQWSWMTPPTNEPPMLPNSPGQAPPDWYLQPQQTQPPTQVSSHLTEERERAATVSTQTPPSRGPRSWHEFFTSKSLGREWFGQPAPTQESIIATRMRGLRPLGSEMNLAIPTTSLSPR